MALKPFDTMEVPQFSLEKKKPLKVDKSEYFSAFDFSLTEKELEKARKELHETEEEKVSKLKELKDKVASDKDGSYRTDTPYLLRFLRVRKYDVDRAFQNIKDSYLFRKNHPELLRIPQNLEQLLNAKVLTFLPYVDENGNILFFLDIGKWKYDEMSFEHVVQLITAIVDVILMNPRLQVNGGIGIWDMEGLTVQHIAATFKTFSPRGLCFSVQSLYPWRMKKIIGINTGRLTRQLFNMVRPFLSKKFSERVVLLGSDITELHQHVNPALLPKRLGGFLEEIQCNVTQTIIDNISYLKYERSFN